MINRIFIVFAIMIYFVLLGFNNHNLQLSKLTIKDTVLLKYKFDKHYPHSLTISLSGNIYVGDGHIVYKFSPNGYFINKMTVPKTTYANPFLDMKIDEHDENKIYLSASHTLIEFDTNSGKIFPIADIYGNDIKQDESGNYYNLYQSYDKITNSIKNKLRVISKKNFSYDYPTKMDLGAERFEIVGKKIVFYIPSEQAIVTLPVVGSKEANEIKKINLPSDQSVNFIGYFGEKYFFQYYDYKEKHDIIVRCDQHFNIIGRYSLKFAEDVATGFKKQDNGDWYAAFPSGIIYKYIDNRIVLLRISETGLFIGNLNGL